MSNAIHAEVLKNLRQTLVEFENGGITEKELAKGLYQEAFKLKAFRNGIAEVIRLHNDENPPFGGNPGEWGSWPGSK